MKILALQKEVPGIEFERIAPHLHAETLRLWEMLQANVMREIYREQGTYLHVLILECASIEEANEYIQSLPLVNEGFTAFDLIPLAPFPGFERLFAEA